MLWLAIGLGVALALRRPLLFPLVAMAVLAANFASVGVKSAVERPRPPVHYPDIGALVPTPESSSFPSGHAAIAFAAAVVLAFEVPRLAWAVLVLAAAVAFSRAYVGVHYPADVAAGAALGAFVATALLLLVRALRR